MLPRYPVGRGVSMAYSHAIETPFRDLEVKEGTQVIDLLLNSKGSR
jgi:hypothetical protein